VFHNYHAASFS